MNQQQDQLTRQWGAILDNAGRAIEWVEQVRGNSKRLNSEADSLVHALRQTRNKSRNLQKAAGTPMTVGFFGESQAGKSFLISALGANDQGKFETVYGGQRVNFIDHINPPGSGKEATGLVTRFTNQARTPEDAAFPIEVRLLAEIDLAKILCNAWFNDFDQNKVDYQLNEQRVSEMLNRYAGRAQATPQEGLSADDVVSLWDYARAAFGKALQPLENGYWQEAMTLAPRLSTDDRAQFFSLLWGALPELTQVYADFAASLRKLKNASTAFLPLSALTTTVDGRLQYGRDSIMSVDALVRQGSAQDNIVTVRPEVSGKLAAPTDLRVSHLAALTVELVFPSVEPKRVASIEAVDLLDFPGYRGRYKASRLSDISADENPVAQLFLRGKVAYLFESYTDTQAMNGLVLCTHEQSNVSDIANVLERWVDRTQGETPQSRGQRACGLFWAITKFDMRLQNMLRLDGDSQIVEGWYGMVQGTMEERYGHLGFMKTWSETAFNNVYLVRKPLIEGSFIKIRGGLEEIDPDKREGLARLGQAFISHDSVARRVADPQRAWEAVLKENDGGMSRLADGIAGIADLEFKLSRLRQQHTEELQREGGILARLAQYHKDIDGDDVALKKQRGQFLAQALYGVRKAIPELMHAMELPREDLRDLYLNGLHRQPQADESGDQAATQDTPDVNPFASVEDNPFATADSNPFAQSAEAPAAKPVKAALKTADHLYAEAVFQRWIAHLRDLPERKRLIDSLFIKKEVVETLVDELITAANRLDLQGSLAASLTGRQDSSSTREQLVMRQVLRAQLILNDFIAWLGYLTMPLEERPVSIANKQRLFARTTRLDATDLPQLDEQPADTNTEYAGYWLTGLMNVVQGNAGHMAGSEISIEQNQALGGILQGFRQT
ncbi:hypothetical protein D0839_13990 [Bordetella avium]|uniref:putative virulence factor n=1 Tax=Bordetella avium TaxID=521 RepID=UPI000E696143|nr:putative virulence factor [Bordetella avium]RIQ67622.1 hypothetical protein D0839_13990 [Bordetella avium]